jgi:hypothetical integral membrane protein (TIGR02206 family)
MGMMTRIGQSQDHSWAKIFAVQLFGPLHITLMLSIAVLAATLALVCRRNPQRVRTIRLTLGMGLIVNELIWWTFRYSHEGFRFPTNLPLQLCDLTLWGAAIACLTLKPSIVEFAYFGGIAGAGMAILTPDLWSPWPSYPAIYFFIAHGGIVSAAVMLVYGRVATLRPNGMWRVLGILIVYACLVGAFNAIFGTNYMYLCKKPGNASLLDSMGNWPFYLLGGLVMAMALFALLAIPARRAQRAALTI